MLDEAAARAAIAAAHARGELSAAAVASLERWLSDDLFAEWRGEVLALLADADWPEIEAAFGRVLEFGTAGRRGKAGVGPNRINARTIGETAAGLADCVRAMAPEVAPTCVVGYDARRHSREYGELCAEILAARGFKVYLFEGPTATPMLAFSVVHLGAAAGLMITASHNPPEYNGIKAYWRHGGQVVPPYDQAIIDHARALDGQPIERMPLSQAVAAGRVVVLDEGVDRAYWDYVAAQAVPGPRRARVVYSPLEGVGKRCVVPVLERAGFADVHLVASQAEPSSEFANVPDRIANPEVPAAMEAVLERCRALDADAGIASDPDADRIGFVARDPREPGGYRFFTGNQIGVLVSWFTCESYTRAGRMPARPLVLTTAVTTGLIRRIAESYGARVIGDLPVGFRWMGEVLADGLSGEELIVAVEESHGVNRGGLVRDKDAASAALALCELTAELVAQGRTASELLEDLYRRYGYHAEFLHNEESEDLEALGAVVASLRRSPPTEVDGLAVVSVEDRAEGGYLSPVTGRPVRENFLIFRLAGAGAEVSLAIRPSGTEPKLKIYAMGHRPVGPNEDLAAVQAAVDPLVRRLPGRLLAAARGE